MSLILATIAAVVAALFEVTVVRYLAIGTAMPHPVLVVAVVWTVAVGLDGGLVVAFAGGIVLDVLTQRPLGSSAFSLLVAAAVAAAIGSALGRVRVLAPVPATLIASLSFSLLAMILFAALRDSTPIADPLTAFLPGAVYDALLAVLAGPLLVLFIDRRREAERVDW